MKKAGDDFDSVQDDCRDEAAFVRASALRLLTRREYAAEELLRRLVGKGVAKRIAAEIIAQLASEGWQSDQRFAEMFVRSRRERGYGPSRIRIELQQRGVDDALISRHVDAAENDWNALAHHVKSKRFGDKLPAAYAERMKQQRFLQYRGFSQDQIAAAMAQEDVGETNGC